MNLLETEGIVLRTRDLGEADKIVTLYSFKRGKISTLAKGVKKTKSKLAFLVHPFSYGKYLLFPGRTFYTITQGEIIRSHREIRENLWKMAYAAYFCELVDLGTQEEDFNPELFRLLLQTLLLLSKREKSSLLARFFELRFLSFSGYRPRLENCVTCGQAKQFFKFSSRQGGVLCFDCQQEDSYAMSISKETLEVMKTLLRWELWQLKNLRLSSLGEQEIEKILKVYLNYYLPRQPKSLNFLLALEGTTE